MYRTYGKRLLDLALAIPALVLLSPVMGVVALLVRLKLGSPVLFRQERVGLDRQPFVLSKFRTMAETHDASGNLLPDEARLTPFGAFLRSTSLDELPEILTVVAGTMSLVGPRPLPIRYLPRFTAQQALRHGAKPGITGLAQVGGRNALTWEERFELDVRYVQTYSFLLDIKIILLTMRKILTREGISQPGHATSEEFWGSQG